MHLYHLTLSRASGIQSAVYGNFSAPKAQEIVVSRGKVLEMLRPNDLGKMVVVYSTDVFGCIRALSPFRITGATTDHLIVASDSGRIVVLQWDKDRNAFKKIHQETYGKSGCRRLVPGQFLTCDPKGRACMIGAIEKQKFVYVLNRDNAANLTISSPLEAHKSSIITYHIAGLDCGFDNPIFAAIELDYADVDQDPTGEAVSMVEKHLTFYELDLGLNHVARKWSEPIDNGANLLIPVPGGADGPGGVLVCAENFIIYRNQDHEEVRAVIPRRRDLPNDRSVLIVTYGSHKKKALSMFFVQSEYGDIYKVTIRAEGETVQEVKVKYFDTIPPCTSLVVLKTGFLFAASENGNHALYQFIGTGDDDDDVESSSATLEQTEDGYAPVFFEPRPLKNLMLLDEMPSLMPITDMKVANLARDKEEIPQLYVVGGRGPRATLAVLRPGLAVTELAVSPLPGMPNAVFTCKRALGDEFDAYIIVSFANATLVFSIGEEVKETNDSGLLGTVPTICTQLLADNSLLQVHPNGLRHIRPDRRINEWKVPGRRNITKATANERQVAIALGSEIIYFELDQMGQLLETEKKDMQDDIACLDIAPVPEGSARCRFLVVGTYDSRIRIVGLNPDDGLRFLALQALPSIPESALLLWGGQGGAQDSSAEANGLFLQVALQNGVLMRTEVDRISGQLTDPRSRYLGTRSPKLFPTQVRGLRSMLALSSRPWLGYSDQGRFTLAPLSYEPLDYAASFASDQCPEGFVAVSKGSLRILAVENVGETFNQQVTRLRYTPRRLCIHHDANLLVVGEADHAAIPLAERDDLRARMETEDGDAVVKGVEFDEELAAQEEQFGSPCGQPGQWAACLRILDPASLSTVFVTELDNNEGITSMCLAPLVPSGGGQPETMLVVGTAQGLRYTPTDCDAAFVRIYRMADNGRRLELVHKTATEGGPVGAVCAYKGRLLVSSGPILRMFELGKKKLLRKCEYRRLPHHIMSIQVQGNRIYVGDAQESLHMMKYKRTENVMYVFADETSSRYLTCTLPLDYDTVAVADKFGNFGVLRLPGDISQQVEDDPTGGKLASTSGKLNGAPHKVAAVSNFHVGDTITAMQRAAMQPGGQEVIVYATVMGAIGAFYPFSSREDADFFTHLEMHMRQEHPPLCGRDHMAFRGAYWPVKDTVDGDLCAQFPAMPAAKQKHVAEELERTPGEVLKKLEDVRNKIM